MKLVQKFPSKAWSEVNETYQVTGKGISGLDIVYATDDTKSLNGSISVDVEISSPAQGFGLVCRASRLWDFLGIYFTWVDYEKKTVDSNVLNCVLCYSKRGKISIQSLGRWPVNFQKGNFRVSLETDFGKMRGTISSEAFSRSFETFAGYIPFSGSFGVLSVHGVAANFMNYRHLREWDVPINARSRSVFLCHSSLDKPEVVVLASKFAKRGIGYWLDSERIGPGDPISGSINEGLKMTDFLVPFLSDNLEQGIWSRAEYGAAINTSLNSGKKKVLPVYKGDLNEDSIPYLLRDLRRINIDDDKEFEELIEFLKL